MTTTDTTVSTPMTIQPGTIYSDGTYGNINYGDSGYYGRRRGLRWR
jgi:hypothetical protein